MDISQGSVLEWGSARLE